MIKCTIWKIAFKFIEPKQLVNERWDDGCVYMCLCVGDACEFMWPDLHKSNIIQMVVLWICE